MFFSAPTSLRHIGIAAAIVGMALLGGCKSKHLHTGSVPTDGYKTRHPIIVAEAPEILDIPVGSQTRSLSPDLADTIKAFARDARSRGDGGVEILVPSGSSNETAALYVARQIRSAIVRAGIPGDMISSHTYRADDPQEIAPIRLSYLRLQATANRCGLWKTDLADNLTNRDYSEFGCSTQSNLAAIVANPSDLIHPRASTPSDTMRRSTVFDKYRKGEKTGTEYGDENSGQIANVGG